MALTKNVWCCRRDSSHDDNHHPHHPDHPEDQGSGGRVVQGGQRQPGQRRAHRQGWLRGGGGYASAQPRRGTSQSRQETEQRRERVVRVDVYIHTDIYIYTERETALSDETLCE
jgi:hypothetical protein